MFLDIDLFVAILYCRDAG